jgi:hypothetical protein
LAQSLFGVPKTKSTSPHGAKAQITKEKTSRQTSEAEKASQTEDPTG